ncbi:MAG: endonuclease/exonuclease/phosphatase family protein [Planctomycetales bacterium]|jgi:vancomycin resistance protein VanJ
MRIRNYDSTDQLSVRSQKFRWLAVSGSVLLLVVVSLCFVIQPDWLASVILVPAWCWLIPGLMLACFGFCRGNKRWSISVLALWAVFTWQFVEEARSLSRFRTLSPVEWQTVRECGHGIRIVSLNCNVGKPRCVEDVAAWEPDVVLLQESPGHEQLQKLTELLFGSDGTFLHGGDVSILARGKLTPRFSDRRSHFVHAEVELPTAAVLDVVSVRLSPPVPRFDFWLPGFWSDHCGKRIEHRQQIRERIEHLHNVPAERRLIVGGDFNAPPRDDALALLRSRLSDAFAEAGNGWGATGTNEYPLFRVDQIWVSKSLQAASVTAKKTLYSDHRLVVCDLLIAD